MNIKKENRLKLNSLINHRNKICNTEYSPSYTAIKESSLKILNGLIEKRIEILKESS